MSGTLDGKLTPVEHTIVALGGQNALVIELYATPDGALMEADLNAQNLRVERVGWKLANHPAPVAPPKGEAPEVPNADGNGQEPAPPQR